MKTALSVLLLCCFFAASAQVNLSSGLIAYYPFNGNTNDASGNNINGTNINATLTTDQSGTPNSAYYFDGSTSYIQLPFSNLYNFAPSGSLSLSVWILPDNYLASQYEAIVVKSPYNTSYSASNWNYGLYLANYKAMSGFANNNFLLGTTTLAPNQCWHHLLLTYQNGNWNLYVDGILEAYDYSQTKYILQDGSSAICFGKKGEAFGDWFKGKLDEVRIYNRVLNQQEIGVLSTRTVPCGQIIINQYAAVTSRMPCDNTITIDTATSFNVGDTILMVQMKGAVIDTSNTASFGTVLDYKGAGNYEYNVIKAKNGNNITLKYKVARHYDIPEGKVQIVRVPYYQNYTINTPHTCMPWNGSKGGVFAVNVNNTLTMNSDIDVSGSGFGGAISNVVNSPNMLCNITDYFMPYNIDSGGRKGEGLAQLSASKYYGRGQSGNGGGGGDAHNSGGGGGSNSGAGGIGGFEFYGCNNNPPATSNSGIGGNPLSYSNTTNKIFLGGGGGSSQVNNMTNAKGGDGGGIVIITAGAIAGNGKHITANGADATGCINNGSYGACHDGMGGGGGGGVILLNTNTVTGTLITNTTGGKGGDESANAIYQQVGPGGGGGGGMLWLKPATIPAAITASGTGGANGMILYNNTAWGAQPGQPGQTLTGLQLSFPVDTFKPNILSVNFADSAISCYARKLKDLTTVTTTGIASWLWTFPDGSTATTQNATFTFSGYGTFAVKLAITDSNGCKDSIVKNITIPYTHFADAGNDTVTCIGVPTTLHASGGINYSWSPAAGLSNPNAATTTASVNAPTDYIVTVTNSAGCIDNDTVHIDIIPGAVITVTPHDTAVCTGKQVLLNAYGAVSYTWSPTTGLNNSNIASPAATIAAPIDYIVTGTAANGCIVKDTVHISIRPGPQVYATSDGKDITCYQSTVQLYAHGASLYTWSPGYLCNDSTAASPIVDPSITTVFTVKGTDIQGCTGTDTITVKSYKDVVIFMPDAFTPNGDGLNDNIRPRIFCEFVFEGFYVLNRWGETMYMTNHIQGAWDGTFKGVPQPMGVYHYMVKGTNSKGESLLLKGNFTLVR